VTRVSNYTDGEGLSGVRRRKRNSADSFGLLALSYEYPSRKTSFYRKLLLDRGKVIICPRGITNGAMASTIAKSAAAKSKPIPVWQSPKHDNLLYFAQ
jgi:hypothetical protein